jgi:hypothetical protein
MIFSYRIWQSRQIIWTQDTMYIARGDVLVDSIPLHEVMGVEEMTDEPDTSYHTPSTFFKVGAYEKKCALSEILSMRSGSHGKDLLNKHTANSNRQSILQVKTILDGFNLGRIYYLKPSNGSATGACIVRALSEAVSSAKRIAERKSRFEKSQDAVRGIQESLCFQITVAILIMLVSELPGFVSW